ncbi:MAG: TlpA family protein disulfide reductase [Gammaproteobacteria bacterium]|nr:TlpA family protein disulfide reductase [Gammaproteobacteria bacterium]
MFASITRLKRRVSIVLALSAFCGLAFASADREAPDFTLPTDHGDITLSQLRGQVVYVDFWASWCGPCRKSFPWMSDLQGRYEAQGLKVLAINLDSDRALGEKFLARYPARFTVAYNPEGDIAEAYGVTGMPTSYLIDREGHIHAEHLGFRDSELADVEGQIRALLAHK